VQADLSKFMDESLEIRGSESVKHTRDFSQKIVFESSGEVAVAVNFGKILNEIFCNEIDRRDRVLRELRNALGV
jgi:hypothetical protein